MSSFLNSSTLSKKLTEIAKEYKQASSKVIHRRSDYQCKHQYPKDRKPPHKKPRKNVAKLEVKKVGG